VAPGAQIGIALPARRIREAGTKAGGPSLGFHALVNLGRGHAPGPASNGPIPAAPSPRPWAGQPLPFRRTPYSPVVRF